MDTGGGDQRGRCVYLYALIKYFREIPDKFCLEPLGLVKSKLNEANYSVHYLLKI